MRTWVSWILLMICAVLMGISGVGIWVAVDNFGSEEEWTLPTPPPTTTTTTTTTTTPYPGYRSYSERQREVPYKETPSYRHYVNLNNRLVNLFAEPRVYAAAPSIIVALNSILTLGIGLLSSKMFTSTDGLYSTTFTWAATLVSVLAYQNNYSAGPHFPPSALWVLGLHVVLLVVMAVQMMLWMWELRRQKSGWPDLNIMPLFTPDVAILLLVRVTLAVFIIIELFSSAIVDGLYELRVGWYDYDTPHSRYPLWLSVSALVAALYNAMVTTELTLSTLTGSVHKHWAWTTTLLTAFGNGWLAILASPVFVQTFLGHYYTRQTLMILAVLASIFSFIHTMAYCIIPDLIRTPPKLIRTLADRVSEVSLQDLVKGVNLKAISGLAGDIQKGAGYVTGRISSPRAFTYHCVCVLINIIIIVILGIAWDSPMWRAWGAAVLMGVNIAGVIHSLPPLLIHLYLCRTIELESFAERVIRTSLEVVVILVGSIAVFSLTYSDTLNAAAVIDLLYIAIKVFFLVKEGNEMKKNEKDNSSSELLEEEEEEEERKKKEEEEEEEKKKKKEEEEEKEKEEEVFVPKQDLVSMA